MRKNIVLYKLLFLIAVSSILLFSVVYESGAMLDIYDFPIEPGTDEWKAFTTHEEMVKACRIPTSVLRQLPTDGLIETVLTYPLINDVWAYNTPQQGISAVISQFNGLQELLIRHDSGARLLAKYASMDIESMRKGLSDLELIDYYHKVKIVEMVIAQQPIVSNLSTYQIDDLVIQALAKGKQEQQEDVFSVSSGVRITAWLISRTLKQANYEPFLETFNEDDDVRIFVSTGFFYNNYDKLFELANCFTANK